MAVASVADYRECPRLDAPATPERVLMAVERLKEGAPIMTGHAALSPFLDAHADGGEVRLTRVRGSAPREAGAEHDRQPHRLPRHHRRRAAGAHG